MELALSRISGQPPLAYHGLQRSGTNYLLSCLKRLEVNVLNRFDPERNDPRHKHFRWQPEKSSIPTVIRNQYGNCETANSLRELNQLARWPSITRHLVIRKDHDEWLQSVLNWGLRCAWFTTKDVALSSLSSFSDDYSAYFEFWQQQQTAEPDKVAIVSLNDITHDIATLQSALAVLDVKVKRVGFNGQIDEVPQSPKNRSTEISADDITSRLDEIAVEPGESM